MAIKVIQVKNISGGHIQFEGLKDSWIDDAQTKDISTKNGFDNIYSNASLYAAISVGDVVLVVDGFELDQSQYLAEMNPKSNIVIESTTSGNSQGLSSSDTTLNNLSVSIGIGKWEIQVEGVIDWTNTRVQSSIYDGEIEIGGANGHTHKKGGVFDGILVPVGHFSWHSSSTVLVSSGTKTISCRARELQGTQATFIAGRIKATKVD